MIIINCGMAKAGTSLVMQYQKDLVRHFTPQNGQEKVLKHSYGGYVGEINYRTMRILRRIATQHGDFAVKTHSPPSFWIRRLIAKDVAKASFCFRDPRDTVLSARDHGVKSRKGLDPSGGFANIRTIKDAISLTKKNIQKYYAWRVFGKALFIRYEELMVDKMSHLRRIAAYFGYPCEEQALADIFQKHERIKEQAWNFNKGTVNRWKSEMSGEELALCNAAFKDDLAAMGYELQGR